MYRVQVAARGMGFHEDYTVSLPTSTLKEDFMQIIDDGIQVQNLNFVQSIELVRLVVPPVDLAPLLISLFANGFLCKP